MNRVLIIGSDFAPSSLPPATRIRFFATHLPEFGWEPIVLTTKSEFYDWPTDPENENLLPKSVKVVRTDAWSPRWTRKIGFGDIGMRSLWSHWRAIKRICREQQIDLIFIPVPPYVPMVLGRMAHQKFRIPYVIDYIDPWVTEYYWRVPRNQRPPKWPLAYAMSRLLEPYSLRRVAAITGVSKGTTESVVRRYEFLAASDATEIPYGAETADFEYVRSRPRGNPLFDVSDGLFHMTYVGACIPGMYSAVRALFGAVKLGLDRAPDSFRKIRLHFVGTSYARNGSSASPLEAIAREVGIPNQVEERSKRVDYLDSLQLMMDSNALLLVGSDEPHYTASKVFPYLLSDRPVLAVFHESSSVGQILNNVRGTQFVGFNDTEPPQTKIEEIFAKLQLLVPGATENTSHSRHYNLAPYTTRAMTSKLAEAFERAVRKESAVLNELWNTSPNGVTRNHG